MEHVSEWATEHPGEGVVALCIGGAVFRDLYSSVLFSRPLSQHKCVNDTHTCMLTCLPLEHAIQEDRKYQGLETGQLGMLWSLL